MILDILRATKSLSILFRILHVFVGYILRRSSMKHENYLIKEKLLDNVEQHFPFVSPPQADSLYAVDLDGRTKKIIESSICRYLVPELCHDGVMILHNKFSMINQQAVEWIFPSLLRIALKGIDTSNFFYWCFSSYFEDMEYGGTGSAYDFSWLSGDQISVLQDVLEYVFEEYKIPTFEARKALIKLEKIAA